MSEQTRTTDKARLLALYLPQFHPVPENDEWWGKGFTEWTNVAKARPLYRGHYQPHIPADLGFYDLRLPETREAQAALAQQYGVEAFCYYHYWFGNKRRILERPFNEVLRSGKPDFPFCLCWANQTWSGVWFGQTDKILMEQVYPGRQDIVDHFNEILPAFIDPRYVTVDGKPLFIVYDGNHIPNAKEFTDTFRELAAQRGLKGLYLLVSGVDTKYDLAANGFDGIMANDFHFGKRKALQKKRHLGKKLLFNSYTQKFMQRVSRHALQILTYEQLVAEMAYKEKYNIDYFPVVLPNWDNTPRSGTRGLIVTGATPDKFEKVLTDACDYVQQYPAEKRLVFLKSWNEWAEGNYVEPDVQFGHGFLKAIQKVIRG